MADIVERLRKRVVTRWVHSTGTTPRTSGHSPDKECIEAADEIERLRAEVVVLRDANARWQKLSAPAPAPLLVRDLSASLKVDPLALCRTLEALGYGPHSVNMAVPAAAVGAVERHYAQAAPAPAPAEPVATLGTDGHPRHISHVWGVTESRLYGPPIPLYTAAPAAPAGWTDADADAARLALELECLLTDKDIPTATISRWWDSAHEALRLHRERLAAPGAPQGDAEGGPNA